jgi:sodium-dependent dicarboxylate transporter 2/3/5
LPETPQPKRLWILALALALAVVAALLAPEPWPVGEGEIRLEFRGQTLLESRVQVGSAEPVLLQARSGDVAIEIEFPKGVPIDAPIRALVRVRDKEVPIQSELGAVAIALRLSDGREEPIPSVRFHDDTLTLEAQRRPPVRAAVVLSLLGAVVVLWVSEFFPLFVTSLLIPVVLVFSGVASASSALQPFFSPIIALFFGGFLMAEAMRRSGLDRLAAVSIVAKAGRSPVTLFGAMLCTSAFLSMWMSNTAAVALLTPIAIAITEPLHHLGYRKAVVLGIAYAGTLGGVGSAIGTPANQLAIEFLGTFDVRSISFAEWFAFGLPVVVLLLPILGVYLWKRMGVSLDLETFQSARAAAKKELENTGRPTRHQYIVLAVFAAVVAGWLTQTAHGIHPGIVALAGAVVLAALRRIVPEDLTRISWSALLTFGGGLTLGLFLVQTGTSDWVATRLGSLAGLPSLVAILVVALIALVLTSVASNTASAAILIPIAIPLASVIGVDPVLLVMVVAISSSLDFALVIGTPPTMIAYSTKLYTPSQIFRIGIVLDVIGVGLLAGGVVWLWRLFGMV